MKDDMQDVLVLALKLFAERSFLQSMKKMTGKVTNNIPFCATCKRRYRGGDLPGSIEGLATNWKILGMLDFT